MTGPIGPERVGVCSLHEHLLWSSPGWEYSPEAKTVYDAPRVSKKVAHDLLEFKAAGGATIVDCTGVGIGRDPERYAAWSRDTGVNVVAATGFWAKEKILPYFAERDTDYMTELMVHELTVGMGTTSIRAGVIKVGNSKDQMWPLEERTYRAAARASLRTGAGIVTHGVNSAERQVAILLEEGVHPSRVIISHLDNAYALDFERDLRIAKQGFFVAYDHVGMQEWTEQQPYAMPDARRVEIVTRMIAAGQLERVVIACDTNAWAIGLAHRGTPTHAFAHLLTRFVPMLRNAGVTDGQLRTMLVETPRRFLPFA